MLDICYVLGSLTLYLSFELWREFDQAQNEMILNRAGRTFFPVPAFSVQLPTDSDSTFSFEISMKHFDDHFYKWTGTEKEGRFLPVENVDAGGKVRALAPDDADKRHVHPLGAQTGAAWCVVLHETSLKSRN